MTKKELEEEILRLEIQLAELKGTECEVYSRVVGYFRPVKNWNAGKQEEFKDRVMYDAKHPEFI